MAKTTISKHGSCKKQVSCSKPSFASQSPVWRFDRIDRNGPYSFDVSRPGFDSRGLIDKLISYSQMTWAQIDQQTHDQGKSKNHFLNPDGLSSDAIARLQAMGLTEAADRLYSLALSNKLRLIGIREDNIFGILWYDAQHQVYPCTK